MLPKTVPNKRIKKNGISVAVRSVSGFRNDIIKQRLNITHESGNKFLLDFFILVFLFSRAVTWFLDKWEEAVQG